MTERFAAGTRVRTSPTDPTHHTRVPRYTRGATGTIVESQGLHPLPDDRSRGLPCEPLPVYTVRFAARDLFDEGDHAVTVDIWQTHLTPVDDEGATPHER
ncbi:MAG: nitrile hydratase subunit beta [Geodermatophilaceae bacterium]|nr:nitrile hydratase subunit beta [Geodermatophilaceae bacterium]